MNDVKYAERRAADHTACPRCHSSYKVYLLVPPVDEGGNCRRLVRYYECEECSEVFKKYDTGFAVRHFLLMVLTMAFRAVFAIVALPFQMINVALSTKYSFRAQHNSVHSNQYRD